MKKCCIFFNSDKRLAVDFYEKVTPFLKNKGVTILDTSEVSQCDFALVVGGDGTLLRASKKLIENSEIHVIAVNAGSLGFLTEIKIEDAFRNIERYLRGDYKIKSRYLLEVKTKERVVYVLNEIVISKGGALTKLLRVGITSNEGYINTYRADGLIIATPTGSTAYSMAAGGPIVTPNLKAYVITPIAPHNLTTRPVVIDGNEELEVEIKDINRTGYIVVDGDRCDKISYEEKVYIKYSDKRINLVLPCQTTYYQILRETLKWGDNLC